MILRTQVFPVAVVLALIPCFTVARAEEPETVARPAVNVLIARPEGPSDPWLAVLAETYVLFRLGANDRIHVVDPDSLVARIPQYADAGATISKNAYDRVCAAYRVSYVLWQNYAIDAEGKQVQHYAELVRREDNKVIAGLDTSFLLDQLDTYFNHVSVWFEEQTGVGPVGRLKRFQDLAIVPASLKDRRLLGELIAKSVGASGDKALDIAQQLQMLVQRDSRAMLGQYSAARCLARAGAFPRAAKQYREIVDIVPEYGALYPLVCRFLRLSNEYDDALRYAAEAGKRNLVSAALLIEKALALEAKNNLAQAADVYAQVLALDKDQPDALIFYAQESNRKGEFGTARSFAQRALACGADSAHSYREQGRALAGLNKADEAIGMLKKAVARMPKDAAVYENLGDLYQTKGIPDTAADYYLRARQAEPKRIVVSIKAAQSLEKIGKAPDALKVLKGIESLARDSAVVQLKIGLLSKSVGDSVSALRYLEQYAKMGGRDGEAYVALGDLYAAKGEYEQAFRYYNHAMPLLRNKLPCSFALGRLYLRKKEPQAAIPHLRDVVEADPAYPAANRLLADAWLGVGNAKNALVFYEAERKLSAKDADVQRRIADINYTLGDKVAAVNEYERLIALDSTDATPYLRLSLMSLEQGEVSTGERYLKRALELRSPSAQAYFDLAVAFEGAGRAGRAADLYAEIVRAEPKREDVWLKLAAAQLAAGRETDAAESYLKLFELDKKKHSARLAEAGKLFEKNGEKKRARQAYVEFVRNKYVDAEVNVSLAAMEYGDRNYDTVVALLEAVKGTFSPDNETLLMLGVSYFQTEKYAPAAAVLMRLLESRADDVELLALAARAFENAGNASQAIALYTRLLDLPPPDKHPGYAVHIGELYEGLKQRSSAIERYEKNIVQYSGDFRSYERLAAVYAAMRDFPKLTEVLHKAEKAPNPPASIHRQLAETYLSMGDKGTAARYYRTYLDRQRRDSTAWCALGTIYFDRKEYPRAIEPLDNAVKLMPNNLECLLMAGTAHKETGMKFEKKDDVRAAISYFRRAREVDAKNVEAVAALVECYRFMNDDNVLVAALRDLASMQPDNLNVQTELGSFLVMQGDLDGAAKALESASRLNPGNPDLHLMLADIFEKKNDPKRKLDHLEQALKIDRSNPDILYALARHYAAGNEFGRAENYYKKALAFRPDDPGGHYEYAQVLIKRGRKGPAVLALELAVKGDATNAKYAYELSRLCDELGKGEAARAYAGTARRLDTTSAAYAAWSGYLYLKADRTDTARIMLNHAILLDKSCAICYQYLGTICMREQLFSEAADAFGKAIAAGGTSDSLALMRAKAFLLAKNPDAARREFALIVKENPDNVEAAYRLVHGYVLEGDLSRARDFVPREQQGRPKTGWHYLAEAEIDEAEGKLQRAFVSYGVAARLLPDEAQASAGMGRICMAQKNYGSAIMYFGKAMACEPGNSEYVLDMGRAYEETEEYASAQAVYEEALKGNPKNPEIYYLLGTVLKRRREFGAAVGIITKGLEIDPYYPKLHFLRAEILRLEDKTVDAVAAYEEAAKRGGKEYHDAYRQIGLLYYHKLVDNDSALKYFKKYIRAGGKDSEVDTIVKKITAK